MENTYPMLSDSGARSANALALADKILYLLDVEGDHYTADAALKIATWMFDLAEGQRVREENPSPFPAKSQSVATARPA